MRIALLSYRSKPHCGGQGVYVRHLSRELVALGHTVEVFSGQPYPDLDPGVAAHPGPEPRPLPRARPVPGAAAAGVPRPGRRPRVPHHVRRPASPSPQTFSRRVARLLAERVDDFDVVHDNQTLGDGLLDVERAGLPVVATIHHPITFDRRIELAQAHDAGAGG